MKTGITVSKTHKCLSTIATLTGAIAIMGSSIAFAANDFDALYEAHNRHTQNTILEPTRSDAMSEPDGDKENGSGFIENNSENENTPDHGTPCFDPNCSVHNPDASQDAPPVAISMDEVKFCPDSAVYLNKEAAVEKLKNYLKVFEAYFERYPEGKIYLVGGIAKTQNWSVTDIELSEQRALTVRQSFIELGVDGDKLEAIGLGISDPWRSDEWSTGSFNAKVAGVNRRVWIIPDCYDKQVELILSIEKEIEQEKNAHS